MRIRLNCHVKKRKMLQAYCLKMLVRILPLHSQARYEGSRGVLGMLDGST
jgi:hypothetical protein